LICFLGAGCSQSSASDVGVLTYRTDASGVRLLETTYAGDVYPATGTRSYDNWRYPGGDPPGQSLIGERLVLGNVEVGDDLLLADWQPCKVNDIGWSLCNNSATGSLTFFGATIRFYDGSLALLGTDTATYSGQTFRPGARALVQSSGGFYGRFNISTTQAMFMSIEFFGTVGVDPGDVGVLYGGPITFGNSSRFARNMTTGDLIDLGASPQANLGFFIDTVVPAPSAASLFAASSLLALRRRR
jgi:hypothetical protein